MSVTERAVRENCGDVESLRTCEIAVVGGGGAQINMTVSPPDVVRCISTSKRRLRGTLGGGSCGEFDRVWQSAGCRRATALVGVFGQQHDALR